MLEKTDGPIKNDRPKISHFRNNFNIQYKIRRNRDQIGAPNNTQIHNR